MNEGGIGHEGVGCITKAWLDAKFHHHLDGYVPVCLVFTIEVFDDLSKHSSTPRPPTKPSFNAFDSNQVYETLYDAVGFNVSDDDLSKFPFQASKFTLEVLQKPKIEAFPMTATVVKAVSRDVQQMAYWLVQTGWVKCSGPACFGTMRKMY